MQKIFILWAEDDDATFAFFSEKLQTYLGERGISSEITRAENGDAVFRHLSYSTKRYDVLLTDIVMPHFNGINTVKELSERHPGLPMIIVSTHTESEEYAPTLSALKDEKVIYGFFSTESGEAWFEATWQAIARKAPTILHLSDIHFGGDHAFQGKLRIDDLINLALKTITTKERIDLVVVSGDLTSRGTEDEFRQADVFLNSIAATLGLGLDRFLIVPGNHDIYRDEEPKRRFSKFVEFLDIFYGKLPNQAVAFERYPELYDAKRQRLHWDAQRHSEESLYFISIYDEIRTVVIGLNSVIAEGGERLDFSKIEPKQLIKISESLNDLRPPRSNYFRIAVFHHNPFSVPSFSGEGEPERVVRNPTLVLHELMKNQVRLVLHGHTHYSIGFKYAPYFNDEDRRFLVPLNVFGAGTLSGKELPTAQSYYHLTVIRCEPSEDGGTVQSATLIPYRLRDDWLSWEKVGDLKISFS